MDEADSAADADELADIWPDWDDLEEIDDDVDLFLNEADPMNFLNDERLTNDSSLFDLFLNKSFLVSFMRGILGLFDSLIIFVCGVK